MNHLIVHIKYDEREVGLRALRDMLDAVLTRARVWNTGHADLGWHYFESLEEASAWEQGAERRR